MCGGWSADCPMSYMTLKSATLFAFVGMLLLTIVLLFDFTRDLSAALRGLSPALHPLSSLIFLLAGFSSTVFLHVFRKTQ
jgi:hypothetical protein